MRSDVSFATAFTEAPVDSPLDDRFASPVARVAASLKADGSVLPARLLHTFYTRRWAGRAFQNALGAFRLHPCGLYLAAELEEPVAFRLAETFARMPAGLACLAVGFRLTVSMSQSQLTQSGDSATIYADWSATSPSAMSPHLEIGSRSAGHLLCAHIAHELAHLFWRTRLPEAQSRYRHFLESSLFDGCREVTGYVDSYLREWLEVRSALDAGSASRQEGGGLEAGAAPGAAERQASERRRRLALSRFERWTEESFCETVAALFEPGYPFSSWQTNMDLERRREKIEKLTGLTVD